MSDLVFTQEEARQMKAMLLQVQNAAIDLAKQNQALLERCEKMEKALEVIREQARQGWGSDEIPDPRNLDEKAYNEFVIASGADGADYALIYHHALEALAAKEEGHV